MSDIAIIGMSGRFPGAQNLEEFWRNLREGRESIRFFSREELIAAGIPAALVDDPHYVRAAPVLEGIDRFDAGFFKYSPREAEFLDPQQRFFLECAWEALEGAGCVPDRFPGAIGIYAGSGGSISSYLLHCLRAHPELLGKTGSFQHLGNDKDFLCTRASYELNLRGPSVTVQTACSTSLVAVHMACQSILAGECDMALAGGVSIRVPQIAGYQKEEGDIFSADGHCRAFDAGATGIVFGSGIGLVLLKPLKDALRDRDTIYAVIKGTSINNDGGGKVSYTASGMTGQSRCMSEAFAVAGVDPGSVSYVEAHGTGTVMGDPIEIAALSQIMPRRAEPYCAVGSVKTNVGHLDVAAGITGLIKTALALHHGEIPPSINFDAPNPKIDFGKSPFYVATRLMPWERRAGNPRRAAVNGLGMGGTNAFIVMEEAPRDGLPPPRQEVQLSPQVFVLSAKSGEALREYCGRYAEFLAKSADLSLAQICRTSALHRATFDHRLAVVAESVESLKRELIKAGERVDLIGVRQGPPKLGFLFSGQGSQYVGMGSALHRDQPAFSRTFEQCAAIADGLLDEPLLNVISGGAAGAIRQTKYSQPALFALEISLFKMWESWGVRPAIMIGHSLGELVAACAAGVFTLEEGMRIAVMRGRLMQAMTGDGAMAAVAIGEEEALRRSTGLGGRVTIASVNGPSSVTLSGFRDELNAVLRELRGDGVKVTELAVSHAFHSAQMDEVLPPFRDELSGVRFKAPRIPLISNLTGTIAGEEIATPDYWCKHLRNAVRFSDGIVAMRRQGCDAFLEIGPGSSLVTMGQDSIDEDLLWVPSLKKDRSDWEQVLGAAAALHTRGVEVDWSRYYADRGIDGRVTLPTYPFQRRSYWIDAKAPSMPANAAGATVRSSDSAAAPTVAASNPDSALAALRGLPSAERREVLIARLRVDVAQTLGLESAFALGEDIQLAELGLESLQALDLTRRLRTHFGGTEGVRIRPSFPLQYPTIAKMADQLNRELATLSAPALPDASTAESPEAMLGASHPASLFQERIFNLYLMRPSDSSFNTNMMVRVTGPLVIADVERALARIIARHDILRATFKSEHDRIVQIVSAQVTVPFVFNDLTDFSGPTLALAVEAARCRANEPFDLQKGPLHRIDLFRLGPNDHLFSLSASHAISDFFTYKQYLNELGAQLGVSGSGSIAHLPEVRKQYREFVRDQRAMLAENRIAQQLEYWRGRLQDCPELSTVPSTRPRPADVTRCSFGLSTFAFPRELVDAVSQLSRRSHATFFGVALSTLHVLLARYAGVEDVCVGIPITNREESDLGEMMGPVINTVAIRGDLSGNPTFSAFLARIQERLVEAFANPDVTIERLVDLIQPERSSSYTPFFQVLFNQLPQAFERDFGPLRFRTIDGDAGGGHVDLQITLQESGEDRYVIFKYNRELIDPKAAERIWAHFQELLCDAVANPDREIRKLSIMPQSERLLVVQEWNRTEASLPEGLCVHQLFERQAKRTPNSIAVEFRGRAFTYADLNERADRLAARLRGAGVGPETLVGVCLERSEWMVITLLAILKAGGAYVPLDPSFPRDRLAYYLEDSRAAVLVTSGNLADDLASADRKVILIDREVGHELDASVAAAAFDGLVHDPKRRAYVLYTSGSTGKPKGVEIEHRAVVNFLESMRHEPGLCPDDVLISVTSLSFDIAGLEIFLPLSVGARVVIASREEQTDGSRLCRLAERGTVMQATPATWRMLIDARWTGNPRLKALCGGEPLPAELLSQLSSRVESLWNMYGPTETTIWSTLKRIDFSSSQITVGRPIANTSVYIVDRELQPVPIGVVGEVLIGGDGVARGYLNREELSAERFLPDPFSGKAGARMYRTGDLGRYLPDGEIECLGRLDQQVKIRGFRVELGEIESALLTCPGVGSAIVLARTATSQEPAYLVAFVVAADVKPEVGELRARLKRRLPDYMVPLEIHFRTEWPLTPNGKVNRNQLLKDAQRGPTPAPSAVAKADLLGRLREAPAAERPAIAVSHLAREIRGLLSLSADTRIEAGDDLLRLGMDSVTSVQLRNRLRKALGSAVGSQLPGTLVFSSRTPGALAELICRKVEKLIEAETSARNVA